MHDMITALKTVGEELDSLHNASPFHHVDSRLSWIKQVVNGDMTETFSRIDFRIFTQQTTPGMRSHLPPYKIGFELWWNPEDEYPDLYLRFGLYSGANRVCQQTNRMSIKTFIDTTPMELCGMLLAKAPPSANYRSHVHAYYDEAMESGWIEDVRKAIANQFEQMASCL